VARMTKPTTAKTTGTQGRRSRQPKAEASEGEVQVTGADGAAVNADAGLSGGPSGGASAKAPKRRTGPRKRDAVASAEATTASETGDAPQATAEAGTTPDGAADTRSAKTGPGQPPESSAAPASGTKGALPAPVASASPPPRGSGSGFLGGLVGGALAAALGIGTLYSVNPGILEGSAPAARPDLSALETRLEAERARVDSLRDRVAGLEGGLAELAAATGGPAVQAGPDPVLSARLRQIDNDLRARLETLAAEQGRVVSALDLLEGRVAQVEARPPVMEGDAGAVTAGMIEEMRISLETQRTEIEALADQAEARIAAARDEARALRGEAEAAARGAVAEAALSRLRAALEAGGPYSGALSDLSGATDAPIPDALLAHADSGVPTLADLRTGFPEAARAALAATSQAGIDADAGVMDRIGAFLRAQTGARSTVPREGNDPDAILSRTAAALADGRLAEAIGLIDTLPEAGRVEMAAWRAAAEARRAAVQAAAALAAALAVE